MSLRLPTDGSSHCDTVRITVSPIPLWPCGLDAEPGNVTPNSRAVPTRGRARFTTKTLRSERDSQDAERDPDLWLGNAETNMAFPSKPGVSPAPSCRSALTRRPSHFPIATGPQRQGPLRAELRVCAVVTSAALSPPKQPLCWWGPFKTPACFQPKVQLTLILHIDNNSTRGKGRTGLNILGQSSHVEDQRWRPHSPSFHAFLPRQDTRIGDPGPP